MYLQWTRLICACDLASGGTLDVETVRLPLERVRPRKLESGASAEACC